jgi:hypothetical protein
MLAQAATKQRRSEGDVDMEIWGLCRQCERWFYCDGWFDRAAPTPTCPVCGSEPTAIENRSARRDIVIDAPIKPGFPTP